MHIDWFVLFAQIVNFLVLVFLLKYFLYGRILNAMDARQARIEANWTEARNQQEKARQEAEDYQDKTRSLEATREELLSQAHAAAAKVRQDLLEKARSDVDALKHRWHDTLAREKQGFLEDLRRRAGAHVYDTIRRVMQDLADAELEERVLDVFLRLLKESEAERLKAIRDNLARADTETGVIVRSGFSLSVGQQDRIIAALEDHAPPETPIRFESTPEIITGIEVLVHGHKVSWSVGDYLLTLEEAFQQALKEEIADPVLS
jgi:F-type H+-transporting ATPase subunit b